MLGVAERQMARPGDHLGGVDLHVLPGLGDEAVQHPDERVADQHGDDRALAPARIGERAGEPSDQPA